MFRVRSTSKLSGNLPLAKDPADELSNLTTLATPLMIYPLQSGTSASRAEESSRARDENSPHVEKVGCESEKGELTLS
jgi:hypothetical protein